MKPSARLWGGRGTPAPLHILVVLFACAAALALAGDQGDQDKPKRRSVFDSSVVLIFAVATLTLVLAGYSARLQTKKEMAKLRKRLSASRGGDALTAAEEAEEEPTLVVSEKLAVFIVVQATAGLLIMYFLLSDVFFLDFHFNHLSSGWLNN